METRVSAVKVVAAARCIVRIVGMAFVVSLISAAPGAARIFAVSRARPRMQEPVPLDRFGIAASYGLREEEGPLAILQKPLDAAFLGDRVVVLDASAPWLRIFDRDGRFLKATMRNGEGPGETTRPLSLEAETDEILVTHNRGVELFTSDGALVRSIRTSLSPLGAMRCGHDLLGLSELSRYPQATALVRFDPPDDEPTTLTTFSPTRLGTRQLHPWFALVGDNQLLLYPEEEGLDRILTLACSDGSVERELPLSALGHGLEVEARPASAFAVHSSISPFPAGLGRVQDRVLWMTRAIETRRGGTQDSVTVVTAYAPDGSARQLTIEGWFQLFDSDPNGWLLFGNAWTFAQNWAFPGVWGDVPAVFLVDGRALVRALDDYGTPLSH
jgi:hypothetical protein